MSVVTFLFHLGFPIFPSNAPRPCHPDFFLFPPVFIKERVGIRWEKHHNQRHLLFWPRPSLNQVYSKPNIMLVSDSAQGAKGSGQLYCLLANHTFTAALEGTGHIAHFRKKLPAQMVQACRFPLCWHEWESSGSVTKVAPASLLSPVLQLCLL